MTAVYQNFGAVTADLVAAYPGTHVDDFGGETGAQAILDRAGRMAAAALTEPIHRLLTWGVQTEVLAAGDRTGTAFSLGLSPLKTGAPVVVYRMGRRPSTPPDPYRGPVTEEYSIAGGDITLTAALVAGEWLLADYQLDYASGDFAWPSMADAIVIMAAADAGNRLFASAPEAGVAMVEEYRRQADAWLAAARAGEWIPDELRRLRFYLDLTTSPGGRVGSVVKHRA